jgi:hypothetical protein
MRAWEFTWLWRPRPCHPPTILCILCECSFPPLCHLPSPCNFISSPVPSPTAPQSSPKPPFRLQRARTLDLIFAGASPRQKVVAQRRNRCPCVLTASDQVSSNLVGCTQQNCARCCLGQLMPTPCLTAPTRHQICRFLCHRRLLVVHALSCGHHFSSLVSRAK